MALAPYFDKAAESAAQALQNFDSAAFQAQLSATRVALAFDGSALSFEGRAALDMAVRLLARLYPTLTLMPLDAPAGELKAPLEQLAQLINPVIDFGEADGEQTVVLAIGDTRVEAQAVIYAGSDSWIARAGTVGPFGCGQSDNPIGAGAAACIAAANVFRAIFGSQLPGAGKLDAKAELSLLNFQVGAEGANGPWPDEVDLAGVGIVGLGAVGNGLLWVLRSTPIVGKPTLIDHQAIELSNLQRYVMTTIADVQLPKVHVSARYLKEVEREVEPAQLMWRDYVAHRTERTLDRVVVALDSGRDRIDVQATLPRRILNAWTQRLDLGLSRHGFLEGGCLACLYWPTKTQPDEDDIIAEAIGLPEDAHRPRIREMLITNAPVGPQFLLDMAARLALPAERLLPFSNLSLQAFYQQAVCGGAVLNDANRQTLSEAPLAHQSALAGVMLAAELIAEVAGLKSEQASSKTTVDLRKPLGSYLTIPVGKAQPNCICKDPDFTAVYRELHAV